MRGLSTFCSSLMGSTSNCGRLPADFHLCYVKQKCGGSQGNTSSPYERYQTLFVASPVTLIMDIARTPYSGPSRKLVVALDIGTTFSGAAYSLLDPGEVPQIQSVTRQAFPPISELVTNGDEREIGIRTLRILGPQKYPPCCITIMTVASVASRMGWIPRTTTSS